MEEHLQGEAQLPRRPHLLRWRAPDPSAPRHALLQPEVCRLCARMAKEMFFAQSNQEVQPGFALDGISSRTKAWSHKLTMEEALEAAPLITKIGELLHNLSGMQIIATFLRIRIWPPQAHAHVGVRGPERLHRISPLELSTNELASHVRLITCTKSSYEININCTVKPYSLENPIPAVISYICIRMSIHLVLVFPQSLTVLILHLFFLYCCRDT